ncbi:MAG: hypothetical protein OXI10_09880, partial [Gammaproteobacteria bacterium]|nr:hypothetical protein [Gammaproteobacteria bacterium]
RTGPCRSPAVLPCYQYEHEAGVRSIGRTARGVRGIRLGEDDRVISLMVIPGPDADDPPRDLHVLISTVNGYGKRTPVADFPRKNRGGMGVIAVKTSERNGEVVSALTVSEEDEVMLITDGGTLIRTPVSGISAQGRNTQGVRLISVNTGERLASVSRVDESANGTPEDPGEDGAGQSPAPEPATIH